MGILDRVTKASEAGGEHVKALAWGGTGTGKSTLCGTAPSPVLYAYTEQQGLLSFKRMNPEADCLKIASMADLRALLTSLRKERHSYASVCLDSFTEMQMLIIDEVAARKNSNPDEPLNLDISERLFIHDKSKSIVRAFRDLPMHVVLTCLAETVVIGDGENARTVTRLMLSGQKLPAQMGQFFNLVGFCFKMQGPNRQPVHRVLFDSRGEVDVKGMPGLRRVEDPDVSYWYERAIRNAAPRDAEATTLPSVDRGGPVSRPEGGQNAARA